MRSSHDWTRETPPFPERIGRYELLLPIASGGSATVYLARAVGLAGFEREVALKLTHAQLREDPAFAHALIQEATIAGRIHHPNVVPVLDVDEDPFGVFLVMEYVEGETLSGLVKLAEAAGQQIPEAVALRIVSDVLEGLGAAHELRDADGSPLGLVHRDVTPHNVLVGVDGVAKLTDFGIAKATTRMGLTATGRIKGKVAYMSPEQALGKALDASTDLWAVGVMLWELMTGLRLHVGTSDAATLLRIVSEAPPQANALRSDLPDQINDVIAHALQMRRHDRPQSAAELAAELEAAALATYGRATRRDVAAWVSELVAERLALRRARIDEVIELRGRLGHLGRGALGSRPSSTPSAPDGFPMTGVGVGPDAETSVDGMLASVPPPSVPPPSVPSNPAPEPTRTETASVTSLKASPRRARQRWLVWTFAAGALAVAGVVATALHHGTPAPEASAAVASASAAPLPASAPSAAPSRTPSAAPRDEALSPDQLPLLPSAHPRAVPRRRVYHARRHSTKKHKAVPAVSVDLSNTPAPTHTPGLLGSPYGKDNP